MLGLATVFALDRGADMLSFFRAGVWFVVFLLLYDSFCRCDYDQAIRPILWFSVVLAMIHLFQVAQGYLGMTPLRIVPDAWHFSGGVRWNEEWGAAPRPAVIFTEVSWYAYYQAIVLSLALIWAPVEITRPMKVQIGLIFVSVLWSGSLAGIVLMTAATGLLLFKLGRFSSRQVVVVVLVTLAVAAFLAFSPIGQNTLGRLLLKEGSGSFNQRIVYPWVRAFLVLEKWPLTGVGIGNEARAGAGSAVLIMPQINNLFAYFLATTGLLGTTGLLVFLIVIGRSFPLELLYFILLGFVSAHGLGENFWVPALLWAGTISIRTGGVHLQQDGSRVSPPPPRS
jgi:hypothetical protein